MPTLQQSGFKNFIQLTRPKLIYNECHKFERIFCLNKLRPNLYLIDDGGP